MRCANCGAELKVGCVYCSVCGKEAQIVSDYSLLEEDFLKGLLKEKKQTLQKAKQGIAKKNAKQGTPQKAKQVAPRKKNAKQPPAGRQKAKGKRKKPVWAFVMVGILILLLAGIVILVHYAQDHSYDYQIKKAEEYQESKDYGKAEQCLKRALELDSTSEDAKMRLAKLYILREQDSSALALLQELAEGTGNRKEAYGLLIQVYARQKEYGILEQMSREAEDEEIQKLLDKIEGSEEEAMISRLTLRSMKRAQYTVDCTGHFGLACQYYCHFTSPIRRYPDLQIHRIIREQLRGKLTDERITHYQEILPEVAKHSSETERRADEVERETEKLKKVQYMEQRIGQTFEGVISGITAWGIYVELPDTVEGMIHVSKLAGDYFYYEEETYEMVGRDSGIRYKLGQKVAITVDSVDYFQKSIDFILADTQDSNA